MNALEQYARELVNISYSDDEQMLPSPSRFSTNNQAISILDNASPKSVMPLVTLPMSTMPMVTMPPPPVTKPKSAKKKSLKKPLSAKEQALQQAAKLEEQQKQLEWFQVEYQNLRAEKKQLKDINQEQLIAVSQMKAKLDQSQQNEKKLHQQLNEQIDVTRQALRQSSEAQASMEQSKTQYILQMQSDETAHLQLKDDMQKTYLKQMEHKVRQAVADCERKHEHRIGQLTRELDKLRSENIDLHKRLMMSSKKS